MHHDGHFGIFAPSLINKNCDCNFFINHIRIASSIDLPPSFRPDGRCGPQYPGPNGEEGICLARGVYPCCSTASWCGNTMEHCRWVLRRDYRLPGRSILNFFKRGSCI